MRTRMPLNEKGMGIVVVLIVMAMVGAAAFVALTMGSEKRKFSSQMNVLVSANLVKQKLVGIVLAPQSWQITQAHNTAAFASFNPAQPSTLDIYTPDSTAAYYAPSNPRAGFDLKGTPCDGFSYNGNDSCPFRYVITLKNHVFQNGNWIDTLHFELNFKTLSTELKLNAAAPEFTFDLVRNLNEQSVESACVSINGVYNDANNACSMQLTKAVPPCTGNQTYRGPASVNGASNCETKSITARACIPGEVIKGFTANGTAYCGTPL